MALTLNTAQFALTQSVAAQFTVTATKPQIMRLVLVCTAADATSGFNPGDEADCAGIWGSAFACCPFSCAYSAGLGKILLNYDAESAASTFYLGVTFTSLSNFSIKVYYA